MHALQKRLRLVRQVALLFLRLQVDAVTELCVEFHLQVGEDLLVRRLVGEQSVDLRLLLYLRLLQHRRRLVHRTADEHLADLKAALPSRTRCARSEMRRQLRTCVSKRLPIGLAKLPGVARVDLWLDASPVALPRLAVLITITICLIWPHATNCIEWLVWVFSLFLSYFSLTFYVN